MTGSDAFQVRVADHQAQRLETANKTEIQQQKIAKYFPWRVGETEIRQSIRFTFSSSEI
jgi:hypothetical protein